MLKIKNALIIDDQVNLITETPDIASIGSQEYKSLINIHNYFLSNSIPVSVINNLADFPLDALESIQLIPRPDMVVMDLDLNSDNVIGDDDINLIGIVLQKLHESFGNFILFIYSSQADEWETILPQILAERPELSDILEKENTIIFTKFTTTSVNRNEQLAFQIETKKRRYFDLMLKKMDNYFSKMWNKEIIVIGLISCILCYIVYFSFDSRDASIFITSVGIIVLVVIKFILSNRKYLTK